MKRSLLTFIADSHGVVVVHSSGTQHVQRHVKDLQRGSLLQAVQAMVRNPRELQGVIVGIQHLPFSSTRSIIATANALAFAARCPVVRVQEKDLHDRSEVLEAGEQLFRTKPEKWLTPHYEALPNISQPRQGARYHENAGGIVFDPKRRALLFVERKDNGVIGTPKGHREAGELMVATAKREIAEETGITGLQLIAKLPSVRYLSDDHGKLPKKIPHHLSHFLFRRTHRTVSPRVSTGEVANLRLLWLPVEGLAIPKKMHRDLRPVLTRALAILAARKLISAPSKRTASLQRRRR